MSLVAALVCCASCAPAQTAVQSNVEAATSEEWHGVAQVTSGIAYADGQGGQAELRFDLYRSSAPAARKDAAGSGEGAHSEDAAARHPVFVYLHGGGYVGGSRNTRDYSCMGPGVEMLFEQLLSRGCDVVSADYSLTPAAAYPVPVEELALLLSHLSVRANDYGIDMQRVAIGGGSAGGQIAGQFAALCTNAEYCARYLEGTDNVEGGRNAREREIAGGFEIGTAGLRAVYLGCALLEPAEFASTGDAQTDAEFKEMQEAYFGASALSAHAENSNAGGKDLAAHLHEADVTAHVTAAFAPTYLTDGNYRTFDKQARRLDAKLTKLGVEHETHIAEPGEGKVPHGYDVQDRDDARRNAKAAARFIDSHLEL